MMPEHPCPLPRKRWWHRGRRWVCACSKKYWLVEIDHDDANYWEVLRYLDDGPDWRWAREVSG